MAVTTQPQWLRFLVNSPYGTPAQHPFWTTVKWKKIGAWKVFAKDGTWYAYDTRWNGWWSFPTEAEARARAESSPKGLDMWA